MQETGEETAWALEEHDAFAARKVSGRSLDTRSAKRAVADEVGRNPSEGKADNVPNDRAYLGKKADKAGLKRKYKYPQVRQEGQRKKEGPKHLPPISQLAADLAYALKRGGSPKP